ncbi:MAG TPA: FAD:protein FMN transferase [Steroidobacteraceae bacterium]
MHSCSPPPSIERARPLLGTLVAVRVDRASPRRAQRAIESAFEAVSQIQRLMSFQDAASDVSRLNREAATKAVRVHAHTYCVLAWAAHIARVSNGIFDVSVAGRLTEWGVLAAPPAAQPFDPAATFRDVELLPGCCVRFRRPLWLDLSGIAKGYAVDRAIAQLTHFGITSARVNAGGDLRVLGTQTETVALRTAVPQQLLRPALEIEGAALATSSGAVTRRRHGDGWVSAHVAGASRAAIDARTTVSVVARRCVLADALTKVVLADPAHAAPVLEHFGAGAYVHHPDLPGGGWQILGTLQ